MNTAFRIDKEGNLSICGDLKFFQGEYTNAPTEQQLKDNLRTYLGLESGNYLPLNGGTITGNLEVNGNFTLAGKSLNELYAPIIHSHTNYLSNTGGTVNGDLKINGKLTASPMALQNGEFQTILRAPAKNFTIDLPSPYSTETSNRLALASYTRTITITVAQWTGTEAPYEASFTLDTSFDGENHTVFFMPDTANVSMDKYNAVLAARISPQFTTGTSGTLYAYGEKPEIDISFILVQID